MSPITGILYNDPAADSYESVQAMMCSLRKYPADAARTWHGDSISLGCHAQWITPESVYDMLPYYDERYRLAITADAIIDNRQQLFEQLQVDYAKRQRITDSELILMAYRRWGDQAPRYLIGDYAFVIWDADKRRLFGARDLLGNRTLYYHQTPRHFAFCTVVEPLFQLPGMNKQLNESWLAEFLAIPIIMDSIDVHGTVYKEVKMLPPAHTFTLEDGRMHLSQFDSLDSPDGQLKLKSNDEYEEAFRDVFQEAVHAKLRTYRQVGISLSGGLDSGTVVSFAASPLREAGKPIRAYSYVPPSDFTDWTSRSWVPDETPFIRAVAQHVGNIQENYLDFPGGNSFEDVDDILDMMEAPYKFIENSFWLKGILEQAQRDKVGIVLSGARGNYSISWGPAYDYYARLLKRFNWMRLHKELKQYGHIHSRRRSRILPEVARMAFPFLTRSLSRYNRSDRPQLIHPELAARTNIYSRLKRHNVGLRQYEMDEFEARDYQFNQLAVSNHNGASSTKLSLRYGVAERDPTSDPRVVRFCLSIPTEQYVQNGVNRSLIRRATEGYLPDKVRLNHRQYGIQGADWIHRIRPFWGAVAEEVMRFAEDKNSAVQGLLHIDQIRASLERIGPMPQAEQAYDPHVKLVMQSLIVARFMNKIV
ncbi:asparagine synthetase B [Paenibacillus sp. CCS19]|uniref:asparagine synthase-related protein n=1 Tax=Paenibacillus sp. CCS19 TaxID=3158387 RepID=UPI00256129CA|nr:asparagine synthase-related protein [Paenibacillus cellulosilyticus]GMK40054.1 asparagine synthetase B [Paenibacillus cellulosilyticus]